MPSSLGDKIRKHRLEKGYSLDKLAKRTDSSKSYLWELENRDTRKPSGEKLTHKRRAQGPRDSMKAIHEWVFRRHPTETLVCARGAKLSLKSLSKRLEIPRRGSRGLIYDLPATARPARIQGVARFGGRSGANVISQAEKFAKLDFSCG